MDGGCLWIRLGRAGKRTDLIAHIDSFLCFSTPVTLFVSWMVSSPRGGGPSAPRQRPFSFSFTHVLIAVYNPVGAEEFSFPFRPRRVLGWIQVQRRYPWCLDKMYNTDKTRGSYTAQSFGLNRWHLRFYFIYTLNSDNLATTVNILRSLQQTVPPTSAGHNKKTSS
jgi:hypothetical protein